MTTTDTLDGLRELHERLEDDLPEIPEKWVKEYHAILQASSLRHNSSLRINPSELYSSASPIDELSWPVVGKRIVCGADSFGRKLQSAIKLIEEKRSLQLAGILLN